MRAARTLIVAAAAVLVVAAPAGAATITIGSDLGAAAHREETHPVDTAFWPAAFASGGAFESPVDGQANVMRLKGMAVPSAQSLGGGPPPFALIHFQTLRPQPDGSMKVIVTSEDFQAPWTGSPDQVSTYRSDYLCVKKGDRIALNDTGGYNAADGYPNGVPFRVFATVPGSATDQFTKADGTNNGDTLQGTRVDGEELLLQVDIGTGPDARPACGGTRGQPAPGGGDGGGGAGGGTPAPRATIPAQSPRLRRNSVLSVAVFCHGAATCTGVLRATAKGKPIGSKRYAIPGKKGVGVRFRFNRTGRRLFARSGKRLRVRVSATTDGLTSRRSFTVTTRH